ncbi:AAA family ATPase [Streptomyces parvus]|uniref:AAA family ATPase n=1 Tax=Streptomyces parvus TaxID=66428 RepID=UPI0033FE7D80
MPPNRRRPKRTPSEMGTPAEFMALVAEPDDILCIGFRSDEYAMEQKQSRADAVAGSKDNAEKAQTRNVYFTPVPQTRHHTETQPQYRANSISQPGQAAFADCDKGLTADEKRFAVEVLNATLVLSGGLTADGEPKYHVYVWLSEKADPRHIQLLSMGMAAKLSGDHKYDPAAFLRVPGTLNHKYDPPRPVEIERLSRHKHAPEGLARLLGMKLPPVEELGHLRDGQAATAPEVAEFIAGYSDADDERSEKRIKGYLKAYARMTDQEGESRHNSILAVTTWALREASEGKVSAEKATEALLKTFKHSCMNEKGRPVEAEYEAIVGWSLGQVKADQQEAAVKKEERKAAIRSKFITLDELLEMEDPEWLIDGVLTLDTLARINGDSGIGKSFVVLDMAAHIALGLEWHGHEVKQGTVIHLIAEGARGHKKRVQAWMKHHEKRLDDHYVMYPEAVQVAEDEAWSAFAEECIARKPMLIILDTQARVTLGINEDGNTDMGPIAEKLENLRKATQACVLLVHHTGHGMERGRGASAMTAVMNSEFLLKRKKDERVITLINTKEKDEADGGEITFSPLIVHVGDDKKGRAITSLVLQLGAGMPDGRVSINGNDADAKRRKRRDAILEYMEENPGFAIRNARRDIAKMAGCHADEIAPELKLMQQDGLVENRGSGNRHAWHRTEMKETTF